ncbi:MAG: FAD:protein FMN transferase, partial [Clostridia bacterium]|nr:FAD:protein FMN transferase [Clostridia bacterium]
MRKLKTLFTILIIITLISGLFYRSLNGKTQTEETRFLFDTVCSITVFSPSANAEISAAFDAASKIHRLTDFFDETSDVTRINSAKANISVAVSREAAEIINLAQQIQADSKGAFDITLAPVSRLWDFKSENPTVPRKEEVEKALDVCRNSKVAVDMTTLTVTKNRDDTQIDLGGIAKGYAADVAAKVLEEMGVKSAILDFGGNIVVVGKNPKTPDGEWRIGLQTPFAPTGEYSKVVEIHSGSTVTSGTYQRYFESGGTM